MRDSIRRVIELQRDYSAENTDEMHERGLIIRTSLPNELRDNQTVLAPSLGKYSAELAFEGRDGTGKKTMVPWVRAYSFERSPSAQQGWYCVYLFHADAAAVSLCLVHGSTTFDGATYKPRSTAEAAELMTWARNLVGVEAGAQGFHSSLSLGKAGALARAYESTTAFAITYPANSVPDDGRLLGDLGIALRLLEKLYRAIELGRAPEEVPAAIKGAIAASAELSNPNRIGGQGFGLSPAERRAVELHAMKSAEGWLRSNGYVAKDVSRTHSYDFDAERGGQPYVVEVKGSTGPRGAIFLTHNEVRLHQEKHPNNLLILVHSIDLEGGSLACSGGVIEVISPWRIDDLSLRPISYQYLP